MTYSHHLWDSLHLIQMQNDSRAKQMRALKSFFKNYKDGLAAFQTSLSNGIKKLHQDLDLPVFVNGQSLKAAKPQDVPQASFHVVYE